MRRAVLLALLVGAALAGCHRSEDTPAGFDARVRAYLLAHPEVIQEAADRLQAKAAADDAAAQRKAAAELPSLRAALERDPRDFVANPRGRVTVTEFFDYRCPHCIDAAPAVIALIRANPHVRFVFKEMPIFGATSEHAARAAMEVKAAGGDYLGLYQRFMQTRPLDDAQIDQIASRMGAGPPAAPAETRQLADTAALFNKLSLIGTPAFIVGDTIVPGEDMDAVLAAIAQTESSPAV